MCDSSASWAWRALRSASSAATKRSSPHQKLTLDQSTAGAAGDSATALSEPMPIVPAGKHHRRLAVFVLDIHQLGDQAGRDGGHQDGRVGMDAYSGVSAHWDGHSLDWYVAVQ